MNTKQVIVVRKFPNLRTGKYCSQVAHASMAFLTRNIHTSTTIDQVGNPVDVSMLAFSDEEKHWLENSFRKIVCYVNSEEELVALHEKALEAGLISHLIEDNGATEFGGVKTKTCIAIGPHIDSRFEGITDNLPLL